MKKFLALLLAICLLTSFAPVMAEKTITEDKGTAEMEINVTVDRTKDTFTVVIPSSLSIDPIAKEATFDVQVKDVALVASKSLSVSVSSANWAKNTGTGSYTNYHYLKSTEENKARYDLYEGNTRISSGDTVLTVSQASGKTEASATLKIEVIDTLKEGVYTDTLTFKVKCTT